MESDSLLNGKDSLNSMIGPGTRFKGEFDLDGLLRIDGDFSGVIRTEGKVLVGCNGRAECSMYAGRVVIGGIVRGDIFSKEKVTILSTGMVIGNISTPRLIIEEGVIFNGQCKISQTDVPVAENQTIEDIQEKYITHSTPALNQPENNSPEQSFTQNQPGNDKQTQVEQTLEKQYQESWRR